MDFGNGAGDNNLLIANEGGSNNLFFRSGNAGLVRDLRCSNAITKREFNHWTAIVRENGD
jgi:hypothetical protein